MLEQLQLLSNISLSHQLVIQEATLIKTLEENGVGRPSTYAPTIETIQNGIMSSLPRNDLNQQSWVKS